MRLIIFTIVASAAIAHAACDPHPMERIELTPAHTTNPLLGSDSCELRAETATTATLQCGERSEHLTLEAP